MRQSVELAWADRWFAIVAVAVQDVVAASLLAPPGKRLVIDSGADAMPELDSKRRAMETDGPAFD